MPNLQQFQWDVNGVLVAILMAPPGMGKTFLAGTFPRPNFMDFDKKIGVLRNPEFLRQFGSKSIEYQQFSEPALANPKLVPTAFDNACRYFDQWMSPGKRDSFDTWIVDSGTSLTMVARAKALWVLGQTNRSKTLAKAQTHNMQVMEQADWGAERSLVEQFCRMVIESGKNVLINVHEKEVDKNGIIHTVPLFTGDSKVVIPSMVPDVWHLRLGLKQPGNQTIRVLVGEPTGNYQIRSEMGIGTIEEPTYDRIVAKIKELQAAATAQGITDSPAQAVKV